MSDERNSTTNPPPITLDEMCQILDVSPVTLLRAIASLKRKGLLAEENQNG